MLTLQEVEIENFMAVQNAKITFSDVGVVSICGPNGVGKSTILDAISFAAYGKPVRKDGEALVNRADLLPRYLSKAGHSSILFKMDDKPIRITRWLKKSRAEVLVDGKPIKIDSNAIGAYINLDHKTFCNVHVLTRQESFVFKRRADRIKLFERFTGLGEIIDEFKAKSKDICRNARTSADKLAGSIDTLRSEVADIRKRIIGLREAGTDIEKARKSYKYLLQLGKQLSDIGDTWDETSGELKHVLLSKQQDYNKQLQTLDNELADITRLTGLYKEKADQLVHDAKLTKKGICDKCGSSIDRRVVQKELDRLKSIYQDIRSKLKQKSGQAQKLSVQRLDTLKANRDFADVYRRLASNVDAFDTDLDYLSGVVVKQTQVYNKQLAVAETRLDMLKTALRDCKTDYKHTKQELIKSHKFSALAQSVDMFINQRLRKAMLQGYLQSFNDDLELTLALVAGFTGRFTDEFDIEIKGGPFAMCSTGEQMRFVFATYLNLFRYAATSKSRFNFLAFDDFDLGVDSVGCAAMADIFEQLGQSMLVLVMSQNEVFYDRFPNTIKATIKDNICKYA